MLGRPGVRAAVAASLTCVALAASAVPAAAHARAPAPRPEPAATGTTTGLGTGTGLGTTAAAPAAAAPVCARRPRDYVAQNYYRGPAIIRLRCGTKSWGYRHLVHRKRWSKSFSAEIRRTVWSGTPTAVGYSRFTRTCPSREIFRVVLGGQKGIITAYRVTSARAGVRAAC